MERRDIKLVLVLYLATMLGLGMIGCMSKCDLIPSRVAQNGAAGSNLMP